LIESKAVIYKCDNLFSKNTCNSRLQHSPSNYFQHFFANEISNRRHSFESKCITMQNGSIREVILFHWISWNINMQRGLTGPLRGEWLLQKATVNAPFFRASDIMHNVCVLRYAPNWFRSSYSDSLPFTAAGMVVVLEAMSLKQRSPPPAIFISWLMEFWCHSSCPEDNERRLHHHHRAERSPPFLKTISKPQRPSVSQLFWGFFDIVILVRLTWYTIA